MGRQREERGEGESSGGPEAGDVDVQDAIAVDQDRKVEVRGRSVHLLYVHGVGVRQPERYVTKTMKELAGRLIGEDHSEWDPCADPDGCEIARFGDHGHGVVRTPSGEATLTVQAFHWGADVPRKPAWVVAGWLLRSAVALSLLQLVAPAGMVSRWSAWFTQRSTVGQGVLGVLTFFFLLPVTIVCAVWALWLLTTALLILVAGVVGAGLLVFVGLLGWACRPFSPRLSAMVTAPVLLINDALSWCSDEAFREWLIGQCERRIQAAGEAEIIAVGHSQGGSILTEWSHDSGSSVGSCTLITLGSGQGILATLRELQQHKLRSTLIVLASVALYVLLVVATLLIAVAAGSSLYGALGTNLQLVFEWLWTLPLADLRASAVTMSHGLAEQYSTLFEALEKPTTLPVTLLVAPLFTAGLSVATQLFIKPLSERILQRTRSSLPGMDVCASRDIVSRPLHVLGSVDRVWRIPQTGTWTYDHIRYLSNEMTVAPTINYSLSLAAEGLALNAEHRQILRAGLKSVRVEHAWQLASVSAVRGPLLAIFGAPVVLTVLVAALGRPVAPGDWGRLFLYVVVVAAVVWACSRVGTHLFVRNSGMSIQAMERIGDQRSRRRSLPRTVVLLILAQPLVGATLPPVAGTWESWVPARSVPTLLEAQPAAITAVILLVAAAILAAIGSRLARPTMLVAGGFAAVSWMVMGTSIAVGVTIVTATACAWCAFAPAHRRSKSGVT